MNKKDPVFICGLARSGTTWISSQLGQSNELQYLKESWMIAKLHDLASWYSNIYNNWDKSFLTWKYRDVDRETFTKHLGRFYLNLLYEASDNKRFIEQTPYWNIQFIDLLIELFPEAYFIFIYRDGRNQVASFEKFNSTKKQEFDFAKSCKEWATCMNKLKEIKENNFAIKYKLVRYEDLFADYEKMFADLCAFVSIESFNPEPFSPNSSFSNHNHISDFNNRWKDWNSEKKLIFKELAGKEHVEWGYDNSDNSW